MLSSVVGTIGSNPLMKKSFSRIKDNEYFFIFTQKVHLLLIVWLIAVMLIDG